MDTIILGALVRNYVDPQVLVTHARFGEAAGMFSQKPYGGGTIHEWVNESAYGNPAVTVAEGMPAPPPSWPTVRRGQIAFSTEQATRTITGEVISALGTNGIEQALPAAMRGLGESLGNRLDTLAIAEITTAIDSAAEGSINVYGLNRVANNWDSAVQNVGGVALTEAHLQNAYDALRTGFRRSMPVTGYFIASGVGQQRAYTDFLGIGPAAALPINMALRPEDGTFDLGRVKDAIRFNGLPWLTIDGLPAGDVFFLHASLMEVRYKAMPRVDVLGKTGYPENFMVVTEVRHSYRDPGKAARITNLA